MKVVYEYSHLGGSEILKVRYPAQEHEIYEVIANVEAARTKVSKEKTILASQTSKPHLFVARYHP